MGKGKGSCGGWTAALAASVSKVQATSTQHLVLQGPGLSTFEGWNAACITARRLPPRVVDPQLSATMKRVDFVGHVSNPFFRRGQPPGEAAAAVTPLRDLRASVAAVPTA